LIKLTPYGKDVILKMFIVGIILCGLIIFIDNLVVQVLLGALTAFLWLFTLYFFRDPDRQLPSSYKQGDIISPADGKVVVIEEVINKEDNLFPKGETLNQVSIFLSPLNVHVNRIPLSGTVTFLKYINGEYLVAFDHKSSERNERSEIGITGSGDKEKILFKQIAGFVARRIVYDVSEGSNANAGERFGMIKFGSRMDLLMRKDYKVRVSIGQIVTAGETLIAEL
jgi:phosphatidylserine decarboxylase